MASINKVIIVGNLGKDPETRYMPNGDAATNITVATTDTWKDKATGEKREATEWHRISFFGKLAEIAGQYLKKGSQVYVEGSLRTRKWQDKEGQDRYTTEIRADVMQMLGARAGMGGGDAGGYDNAQQQSAAAARTPTPSGSRSTSPAQGAAAPAAGSGFDDMDDDIPF